MAGEIARKGNQWLYLFFLVQCVAVLWVPFFNVAQPTLFDLPFFYWYQLLWVLIGAVINLVVYLMTE